MATNETPHRKSRPAVNSKGQAVEPPRPASVPMTTKVERLVSMLRAAPGERLLYARGKFHAATSGRAISLAVVRRAVRDGFVVCYDKGGLFPGYRPGKIAEEIAGQTWGLPRDA